MRRNRIDPAVESGIADARIALQGAEQSLDRSRRLGAEVRATSAELRHERRVNHFAPLVVDAIRKRYP